MNCKKNTSKFKIDFWRVFSSFAQTKDASIIKYGSFETRYSNVWNPPLFMFVHHPFQAVLFMHLLGLIKNSRVKTAKSACFWTILLQKQHVKTNFFRFFFQNKKIDTWTIYNIQRKIRKCFHGLCQIFFTQMSAKCDSLLEPCPKVKDGNPL